MTMLSKHQPSPSSLAAADRQHPRPAWSTAGVISRMHAKDTTLKHIRTVVTMLTLMLTADADGLFMTLTATPAMILSSRQRPTYLGKQVMCIT
jgi:hypothetical protein